MPKAKRRFVDLDIAMRARVYARSKSLNPSVRDQEKILCTEFSRGYPAIKSLIEKALGLQVTNFTVDVTNTNVNPIRKMLAFYGILFKEEES